MAAHRNLPRDGMGETRDARITILQQRKQFIIDLIKMHQAVPFDERNLREIARLTVKLKSVRTGLRSAGALIY